MKYQPVAVLPESVRDRTRAHMRLGMDDVEKVIEQISTMVIRDLRVHPDAMMFQKAGPLNKACPTPTMLRPVTVSYFKGNDKSEGEGVQIHPHALSQLADKVKLPRHFVRHLAGMGDPGRTLLAHNLNELFGMETWELKDGRKVKFLHRIVDGELRGFISRRFNRHLMSGPMLHAFTVACQEVGAHPVSASSSDVRFRVKATLPRFFEPVKGQYVGVGVEWSNSDFGAGALEVATFLWFPVSNRFSTLGGFRRVHIGSVTDATNEDFEEAQFSEATYKKEVETQSSAIHDAVINQLNEGAIESLLDGIVDAYDQKLAWSDLSGKLRAIVGAGGVEKLKAALDEGIEELPSLQHDGSGVPLPTRFWAMSACSWLAEKEEDSDKRAALEAVGGSMIRDKAA